jgi:hypothetical protein
MKNLQNRKNAMVELQIIQIELANNRDYHFRHTVDQWFAYTNGYVTSSGKEATNKIKGCEYVTAEYEKVVKNKPWSSKGKESDYIVAKEHVVPLKVLRDGLQELEDQSLISIEEYLTENVIFATITKEEDAKLRDAGCNDRMPPEFYDKNHEWYKDPFARYKKVGINLYKK